MLVARVVAGLTGLFLFAPNPCRAQAPAKLEFEVASVKPAPPPASGSFVPPIRGGPGTNDPERITYGHASLKYLLINAYNVKEYQISGPGWIDTKLYEISAKLPPGATKEQLRVMLQSLLAERFKLKLHRETREFSGYELVVGKNGSKLKESLEAPPVDDPKAYDLTPDKDGFPRVPPGVGMMGLATRACMCARQTGRMASLSQLTDALGAWLDNRPVVDKTGLTAKYDFKLEFFHDGPAGTAPAGADPQGIGAPDLLTAIQQQLGLKLELKKVPLDVLVIDSVEQPSEN